eukprot:8636582-Pyramimonas_sp.AAC.1
MWGGSVKSVLKQAWRSSPSQDAGAATEAEGVPNGSQAQRRQGQFQVNLATAAGTKSEPLARCSGSSSSNAVA